MIVVKSKLIAVLLVSMIALGVIPPATAFSSPPPDPSKIVGSPACPRLNAHDNQACRFNRGGHDFQVWPNRISVQPTWDPNIWYVTDTNHKDGMFDHTYRFGKDDHISFTCFIQRNAVFEGPLDMNFANRGGYWKTYGGAVISAASAAAGAATGIGLIAAAGGWTTKQVGDFVSNKYGKKSWELQAVNIAKDICQTLAR